MVLSNHITMDEKTSEQPANTLIPITKISMDTTNLSMEERQWMLMLFDNYTAGLEKDLNLLEEKPWRIFIITIYCIVILLGFLENILVACVLLKNKHLHTVTNIFIVGLAFSDILLCVFNLPFQLHYQLTDRWIFGAALCKVIMPTFGVPIFVSSASMLMIAIDRCILIVYPFRKRMSKSMAVTLFILILLFTTVLAIPIMLHTEYHELYHPAIRLDKKYCVENWDKYLHLRHIYTVSIIIVQFFLPLIVTSIVYFQISIVLRNRPIKKKEKRRNHRTNKILVAIVVLFSICWLPWNLFALTIEFNQKIVPGRYVRFIDLLLKIFAMSSACINPFLYGWLNDNFRREFDALLGRKGLSRVRQNGTYTDTVAEPSKTDYGKYTTML